MITKQQLQIYRTHWGDQDLFYYREGTPAEVEALPYATWQLITQLIQDARGLMDNSATTETAAALRARIEQHTADEPTRQLLRQLARVWPRIRPRLSLYLFQSLLAGVLIGGISTAEWLTESPWARLVVGVLLWLCLIYGVRFLVESFKG